MLSRQEFEDEIMMFFSLHTLTKTWSIRTIYYRNFFYVEMIGEDITSRIMKLWKKVILVDSKIQPTNIGKNVVKHLVPQNVDFFVSSKRLIFPHASFPQISLKQH